VLTVDSVNDAPTIAAIAPQITPVGTTAGPLSVAVGDLDTAAGNLTLSGSTSNPTLVPVGNIAFSGSGATRTVSVMPAPGQRTLKDVSFIVLEAAETALTKRCIQSIREHAPGSEVVYVSNGVISCPDRKADVQVDFNVNLGFAAGCNAGAAAATRPILCFMNNDAAFVDDTPAKLLAGLSDANPITAPFSNKAKPPQGDIPRAAVPKTDVFPDMVVGLCMMIPKALFQELDGFDPDLLTYEDDEFCRKAAIKGFKPKVVANTWVDHERHETFKKLGLDVDKVMAKNALIYRKKNPVIRVIVIAKDEEKALPGFFKQFEQITRDWCVLDTGSKDRTEILAKDLGCRVEKGPFEDFASARNDAVSRFGAGADWIIMIDPDERLDEHTLKHLKELLYRTTDDILYSMLQAKYPDGSIRRFVSKPFIWRNKPEIKWVFKVHEKLIGSKHQAVVVNSMNTHLIELHEDGRRQAASGFYDALMSGGAKDLKIAPGDVVGHGPLAYESGSYTMMNGTVPDRGKYLFILRNMGGNWKIEYSSWSSDLPPQ